MDKFAWWNKMLLFWNKVKKIYPLCLVSVFNLAYFIIFFVGFWGVFCSFLETKSRQDSKRPVPWGRFLAEIQIPCSIFPLNTEKDIPFVPFSSFLCTLLLSFRLRYSLKSTLATAPMWQLQLIRWVGLWREGYIFDGNFWLCVGLVGRCCHAGMIINVDFKQSCLTRYAYINHQY